MQRNHTPGNQLDPPPGDLVIWYSAVVSKADYPKYADDDGDDDDDDDVDGDVDGDDV